MALCVDARLHALTNPGREGVEAAGTGEVQVPGQYGVPARPPVEDGGAFGTSDAWNSLTDWTLNGNLSWHPPPDYNHFNYINTVYNYLVGLNGPNGEQYLHKRVWMQMDLGENKLITHIVTQGRGGGKIITLEKMMLMIYKGY